MSSSTKTTKSVTASTLLADQVKPQTLTLVGPTITTLAKAAVLIRDGYVPSLSDPLDTFGVTGQIAIHLEIGVPGPESIEAAKAEIAEALVLERNQHQLEIATAHRLAAQIERAEKQAAIAAAIVEQEIILCKLKAEAEAEAAAA